MHFDLANEYAKLRIDLKAALIVTNIVTIACTILTTKSDQQNDQFFSNIGDVFRSCEVSMAVGKLMLKTTRSISQ